MHPRWFSARGYGCWGYGCWGTWRRFSAHCGHPTAFSIVRATSASSSIPFLRKPIAPKVAKLRT